MSSVIKSGEDFFKSASKSVAGLIPPSMGGTRRRRRRSRRGTRTPKTKRCGSRRARRSRRRKH